MNTDMVLSVVSTTSLLRHCLQQARTVKPRPGIEPPILASDLDAAQLRHIGKDDASTPVPDLAAESSRQAQYAVVETSARQLFNGLLASTSIDHPAFTELWHLLDVISILSDNEQCEPGLIFWLIEELLDSQTIDGCRRVFDYLESRRERLTAKHFKQKNLIILRSCNELLRRLSRAEDTVFCGRVFIFLFQSFPLGDKSSVNLRGEFHVENTTSFDDLTGPLMTPPQRMEIDSEPKDRDTNVEPQGRDESSPQTNGLSISKSDVDEQSVKKVAFEAKTSEADDIPGFGSLYPVFWSLQQDYSNPTRLFNPDNFTAFRKGLALTIMKFQEAQKDVNLRGSVKTSDEIRKGTKRKREEGDDELANSFNPKYLTSRDLFELEISDLAFRRHILVQSLILIDFLLSLTSKAKVRHADLNLQNKSVLYQYTLSEADATWATETRSSIVAYLQEGPEGKFYHRMVDTVLSRDKNWVRWKAENCPPIERAPLSAVDVSEAQTHAAKTCEPRRMRATPLGALDLSFLAEADGGSRAARLAEAQRFTVPEPKSFEASIVADEFDIEMAKGEEDKDLAINARASKVWRALRVASKDQLNVFDRIDNTAQNLETLFRPDREAVDYAGEAVSTAGAETKAEVTSLKVDEEATTRDEVVDADDGARTDPADQTAVK
ncbi:MAG: hypothetical protein M1817_002901 [Caeruleum heppii]|nr:MAG: hypothetical protein M1817_002901 [Caeruleum heppii]